MDRFAIVEFQKKMSKYPYSIMRMHLATLASKRSMHSTKGIKRSAKL